MHKHTHTLLKTEVVVHLHRHLRHDGSEVEETVTVEAQIEPLADRMIEIDRRDGKDLLMANVLLQSRGLVEKARVKARESLDRKA